MLKKALVIVALAGTSIFFMSTAAQALDYPATTPSSVAVEGSATTTAPGEPMVLAFAGFNAFEPTTASADSAVTLGVVKTVVTASKTASNLGAVSYTASATIPGTYTITVRGVDINTVTSATLTVLPADSSSALPNTGFNSPLLAIWVSAGVLVFGIAMVIVRSTVRSKRASV